MISVRQFNSFFRKEEILLFKKRSIILVVLVTLLFLVVGFMINIFFNGDKKELAKTKYAVQEYLLNEKGYKQAEIKEIRTEYSWKDEKRNSYMAFVTFVDEPNNEYEYLYNEEEGIRERGTSSEHGKH